MYHTSTNGLTEAFNRNLRNILSKVMAKSKWDWHERLTETLWAYKGTYKMLTQLTPFDLV